MNKNIIKTIAIIAITAVSVSLLHLGFTPKEVDNITDLSEDVFDYFIDCEEENKENCKEDAKKLDTVTDDIQEVYTNGNETR